MKRLFVITASLVLASTFALAQLPDTPQPQAESPAKDCYVSPRDGATMCPAVIPAVWQNMAVVKGDTWKEFTGKDAGFWTFRKSYKYPALRTNRQVLHSKTILISHAVGFAAMAVACSRRKTSHESWDSELPAMVGMTALDLFVSDKYFTRAYAVAPMIYAAQHYAVAAAK